MPHVHIPGERSVTTVLSAIAKPGLLHWYASKEREGFLANPDPEYFRKKTACYFDRRTHQMKCTCEAKKEQTSTAQTGTDGHALIEIYFKTGIADPKIADFVTHYRALGTRVVEYEPPVPYKSVEDQYYGSFDLLDEDEEGLIMNDFKFANQVYDETGLQLAAYAKAYIEAHGLTWDKLRRGRVWNMDRDTNKLRWFADKPYKSFEPLEKYYEVFKSTLPVYDFVHKVGAWKKQSE